MTARAPALLAAGLFALLGVGLDSAATTVPRPVVVLDPGHDLRANADTEPIGPGSTVRKIKDGGGTRGAGTGIREAELVLDVALRLRALLARHGVRVVLTRSATAGVSIGNVARARIANRARARLFLRIHADGHPDARVRGTHTLVPAFRPGWTDDIHADSVAAAKIVQRELVLALGFPDRGLTERSDMTGFNWSDVPAILVELGFMTNPTEDRALARGPVRRRAAVGLCRGALRVLGRDPDGCA
jgi:N-acetylmuramoyl-L-alanine amidase